MARFVCPKSRASTRREKILTPFAEWDGEPEVPSIASYQDVYVIRLGLQRDVWCPGTAHKHEGKRRRPMLKVGSEKEQSHAFICAKSPGRRLHTMSIRIVICRSLSVQKKLHIRSSLNTDRGRSPCSICNAELWAPLWSVPRPIFALFWG